jgi:hypothetical protein
MSTTQMQTDKLVVSTKQLQFLKYPINLNIQKLIR